MEEINNNEGNPTDTGPPTIDTDEIDEIIGWRPSRARANWRVRQFSMSPRMRQDMNEVATLYDDLVGQLISCCFAYCIAILHILYGRSLTNPRIRRLFTTCRIFAYISRLNNSYWWGCAFHRTCS